MQAITPNVASAIEVSRFEVLTLPIAPGFVTIARKVVRGYFLGFSNLGAGNYSFRMLLVIPTLDASNECDQWQDRELSLSGPPGAPQVDPSGIGNHQSILDVTGGPIDQACQTDFGELVYLGPTTSGSAKVFVTKLYEIRGGWTGLWSLIPNLDGSPDGPNLIANGKFECRGWAAMGVYDSDTETNDVLVHPEIRGTYFPQSLQTAGDPVAAADLDQESAMVPTASGRSAATMSAPRYQGLQLSAKVLAWAQSNGVDPRVIRPFAQQLHRLL